MYVSDVDYIVMLVTLCLSIFSDFGDRIIMLMTFSNRAPSSQVDVNDANEHQHSFLESKRRVPFKLSNTANTNDHEHSCFFIPDWHSDNLKRPLNVTS